jgi:hypothetical protein
MATIFRMKIFIFRTAKKAGLPSWMKKSKAAKETEKEKATPSPEFFSNDGSFMERFLAMQGIESL